jgi:hypothetical protein
LDAALFDCACPGRPEVMTRAPIKPSTAAARPAPSAFDVFQFMVVLPPERRVTMTPPASSRRILRVDVSLAHGQDLAKSSDLS